MTTIYRGLMGTATSQPTDPAARLRAMQQRIASRRQNRQRPMAPRPGQGTTQNPGGVMPPNAQPPRPAQSNMGQAIAAAHRPPQQAAAPVAGAPQRPAGLPPTSGNTGIVPPHMRQPAGFTTARNFDMNAGASTPAGMPSAPSGINPRPGGVMTPDSATGPDFMAGFRS